MEILRGYGLGSNMARLLNHYQGQQRIVPKAGKFLRGAFRTGRGVTQGNPASPMIFNIVVYAVVRAVLDEVCGPQEAQHRLGWATGGRNLVFYNNGGRIVGRYHEWVQDAFTVIIEMLHRVIINTNLDNTSYMFCTPVFILGKLIE